MMQRLIVAYMLIVQHDFILVFTRSITVNFLFLLAIQSVVHWLNGFCLNRTRAGATRVFSNAAKRG